MDTHGSLSDQWINQVLGRLATEEGKTSTLAETEGRGRQPVHVVYGGAHLFSRDTIAKLSKIANSFFRTYSPESTDLERVFNIDASIGNRVFELILGKLTTEAVEDFRIDFEDGYGPRSDDEEDSHAIKAAEETAIAFDKQTLPPFFGIRIKPLTGRSAARGVRTLDLFLTTLSRKSDLPQEFVVTLPKIDSPVQVAALADLLDELEIKLGIPSGHIGIELMIETTRSIINYDGRIAPPELVQAGRGRVRSAHFGAYDYTAASGISASNDAMRSSASDFARNVMQVSLAQSGVNISDGATNVLPIVPHRGDDLTPEQILDNRRTVDNAWKLHFDICRRSLANGFYQGWDLHPAQIPARYAAIFSFFAEEMDTATNRLKNFIDEAARATLVGDVFDDAATGQGLVNFLVRAVDCGAISADDAAARIGIPIDILRSSSFDTILRATKK